MNCDCPVVSEPLRPVFRSRPRRKALARPGDRRDLGSVNWPQGPSASTSQVGVALVAVGGYGRGELSPYSDLDLVLLHSTEAPGVSTRECSPSGLWYPIWDSKIRLDHSVRSGRRRSTADRPRTDLPAMLGMLDLRHIAGDPDLAARLRTATLASWRQARLAGCCPQLRDLRRERARAARRARPSCSSPTSRRPTAGSARGRCCARSPPRSSADEPGGRASRRPTRSCSTSATSCAAAAGRPPTPWCAEEQRPIAEELGLARRRRAAAPGQPGRPPAGLRRRRDLASGRRVAGAPAAVPLPPGAPGAAGRGAGAPGRRGGAGPRRGPPGEPALMLRAARAAARSDRLPLGRTRSSGSPRSPRRCPSPGRPRHAGHS